MMIIYKWNSIFFNVISLRFEILLYWNSICGYKTTTTTTKHIMFELTNRFCSLAVEKELNYSVVYAQCRHDLSKIDFKTMKSWSDLWRVLNIFKLGVVSTSTITEEGEEDDRMRYCLNLLTFFFINNRITYKYNIRFSFKYFLRFIMLLLLLLISMK